MINNDNGRKFIVIKLRRYTFSEYTKKYQSNKCIVKYLETTNVVANPSYLLLLFNTPVLS